MRAVRTNRILRCFLHDVLDLPWSELAANADALEASSSPRFLQRIEASLDQPTHDPYGQPIPTPDGRIETPTDIPSAGTRTPAMGSSEDHTHRGRAT